MTYHGMKLYKHHNKEWGLNQDKYLSDSIIAFDHAYKGFVLSNKDKKKLSLHSKNLNIYEISALKAARIKNMNTL